MKPKKDNQEPNLNAGDVSLAPPEPVSALLRRHRKLTGQDLKTVAQALRIRYVYLEAIEQGRYDALPGSTYALGFIKTYAEYLNLDEEEIVQRFRDDVDGLDDQTQLVFPSPVPEGKVPGGAILLVALIMGALAYGGWYTLSSRDSKLADFVPALPDRLQALFEDGATDTEFASVGSQADTAGGESSVGEVVTSATPAASVSGEAAGTATQAPATETPSVQASSTQASSTQASTSEAPAPSATPRQATQTAESAPIGAATSTVLDSSGAPNTGTPAGTERATGVASTAPAATPAAASAVASGTTVISSQSVTSVSEDEIPAAPAAPIPTQTVSVPDATQPQVYGEGNTDARIILRATQDAWVQVRDGSDELLLTRVLREGDVYRVPNEEGLTLLTGNAGGIEVLVDGTLMAPLGPVGSVRRDLALDPQVLLAGATPPQ